MATYLTEDENDFPAADQMQVPESFDVWGGAKSASATVRGVARTMLNRTAWIKKRLVKLAEDNILTAVNEFRRPVVFTPTVVNEQMFGSSKIAIDAPNPPTNRWQIVGRFKTAGGLYCNVYTGTDGDTRGSLLIALNAIWDVNASGSTEGFTGTWSKYQNNKAATALIWRYGNVRVASRAANDNSSWDFWGDTYYSNGGNFQAQTLMGDTLVVNTAVNFRTAPVRTLPISITGFRGAARFENDGTVSTLAGSPGQMPPAWQFTAPTGCRTGTITIKHHQDQTDVGDTFELWARSNASAGWSVVATKVSGTGVVPGGERSTELRPVADVANDGTLHTDGAEYLIVWKIGAGGANNRVRAFTVERWEPGLRNSNT